MKNINTRKWSTPVIIGSGLFVTVSGVLMFYGVHNPIELAHEWIGLLFAAGIVLHVLNHWRAFKNYFSQRVGLSMVGAVAIVSSTFVVISSTQAGGSPMMRIVNSLEASPISEVAPLLDESAQSVVSRFQAAGLRVDGSESTINEIAAVNGSEPKVLIQLLFSEKRS